MRKAAFFGPKGSNGHDALKACSKRFGLNWEEIPYDKQPDVITAVAQGDVDIGIFAFENSTIGPVAETERRLWAMLRDQTPITLFRMVEQPIVHNLYGPANHLVQVHEVISHPAAGAQCANWLQEHGLGFSAFGSTAGAVERVMKEGDPSRAAIGSVLAAKIYGAGALAENIQDEEGNSTTFLLVGREQPEPTGCDRSVIIFEPKSAYTYGTLHRALGPFTLWHVNMCMIQSVRYSVNGSKVKPVRFWVEIEGHLSETHIAQAIREMREYCDVLYTLGSCPAWE